MKSGAFVIAALAFATLAALGWFGLHRSAQRERRCAELVTRVRTMAALDGAWRRDVVMSERGDADAAERLVASLSELSRLNGGFDTGLVRVEQRDELEAASDRYTSELLSRSEVARRMQAGLNACRGARARLAIDLERAHGDAELAAFAREAELLVALETLAASDVASLGVGVLDARRAALEASIDALPETARGAASEIVARVAELRDALGVVHTRSRKLQATWGDPYLGELGAMADAALTTAHVEARNWAWAVAGLALFLVAAVAGCANSASRTERAIARLRLGFERRMRERTEELSRKNGELASEIQERSRAEGELLQARQSAEAASRSKSEFLANMSHEIRTPMTSILGYAERLGDRELDAGERHEAVETIRRSGEYLLELINDILDLSKIEAGKLALEQIPTSPAQIVLDVQASMDVRAKAKGLLVAVDFPEPVPARIVTDPVRLKQVLLNLLGNAIKFTERGEIKLTVRFEPHAAGATSGPFIVFAVSDTGIGLDEAQIRGLFRPFTQAESSTARRFGGTGLGLSICKTLVERMGGDIQVRSRPGHGSTFTFRVETGSLDGVEFVSTDEILRLRDRIDADRMREHGVQLECRVLLVEDGEDNQRLLAHYLRRAGADVALAVDGHEAVSCALEAQAAGRAFDVIVMDMQMPRLDGYGATLRLRAAGYKRPIVALTANAMAHDRKRCLDAGCDDFCTKPIDKYRFLSAVARWARPASSSERNAANESQALARTSVRPLLQPPVAPVRARDAAPSMEDAPLAAHARAADAGTGPTGLADVAAALPRRAEEPDPELAELVREFVADLRNDVERLTQALEAGDFVRVAFLAHQLKGSAGSYGFPEITRQAARLETCAKGDAGGTHVEIELEDLARLCRKLQVEHERR